MTEQTPQALTMAPAPQADTLRSQAQGEIDRAITALKTQLGEAPASTDPGPRMWPAAGYAPAPAGPGFAYQYFGYWVWQVAGRHFGARWSFKPGATANEIAKAALESRSMLIRYVQSLLPVPPEDVEVVPSNPGVFNPDGGRLPL